MFRAYEQFQRQPGLRASVDSIHHLTLTHHLSTWHIQKNGRQCSVCLSRVHLDELTVETDLHTEAGWELMDSSVWIGYFCVCTYLFREWSPLWQWVAYTSKSEDNFGYCFLLPLYALQSKCLNCWDISMALIKDFDLNSILDKVYVAGMKHYY